MFGKRAIATLTVATIVAVVAAGAPTAPEGTASNKHASGNRLAGTWLVTAERPAPLPPFTVQQVYTRDGSFISLSDFDGGARTPEMGSWERVEGRLYASSGSFFRYDPQTRAHIGSTQIDRTVRLSDDGQSFTSIAGYGCSTWRGMSWRASSPPRAANACRSNASPNSRKHLRSARRAVARKSARACAEQALQLVASRRCRSRSSSSS